MNTHWGTKKEKTPRKADATASEKHISVQDNKIYFYSGVNRNSCSELNKKISELEAKAITLSNSLTIKPPPIKLFINSGVDKVIKYLSKKTKKENKKKYIKWNCLCAINF